MSGTSVCAGDGGAPLIAQINDDWYLVGVASWSLSKYPPLHALTWMIPGRTACLFYELTL